MQRVVRPTRNRSALSSIIIKWSAISLSKTIYLISLEQVGSMNGFEGDFTIQQQTHEGLMNDYIFDQKNTLVRYRQNENQTLSFLLTVLETYFCPDNLVKLMVFQVKLVFFLGKHLIK